MQLLHLQGKNNIENTSRHKGINHTRRRVFESQVWTPKWTPINIYSYSAAEKRNAVHWALADQDKKKIGLKFMYCPSAMHKHNSIKH